MYPSLLICLNVSRETKVYYVISIDDSGRTGMVDVNQVMPTNFTCYRDEQELVAAGLSPERVFATFDVNEFFLGAIYTKENAVAVGSQYFNLPNYEEMSRLIDAKLGNPSYSQDVLVS